jgi:hypothetical protein
MRDEWSSRYAAVCDMRRAPVQALENWISKQQDQQCRAA